MIPRSSSRSAACCPTTYFSSATSCRIVSKRGPIGSILDLVPKLPFGNVGFRNSVSRPRHETKFRGGGFLNRSLGTRCQTLFGGPDTKRSFAAEGSQTGVWERAKIRVPPASSEQVPSL